MRRAARRRAAAAPELHVLRASRRSAAEPPPAEPSARCSRQSQRTEKSCSRAVERRVDSSAAMSIWSGHASASSGPTHTSASRGANARRGEPPGSCSPTAARPAAARPCLVDGQQPHGRRPLRGPAARVGSTEPSVVALKVCGEASRCCSALAAMRRRRQRGASAVSFTLVSKFKLNRSRVRGSQNPEEERKK